VNSCSLGVSASVSEQSNRIPTSEIPYTNSGSLWILNRELGVRLTPDYNQAASLKDTSISDYAQGLDYSWCLNNGCLCLLKPNDRL